LQLEKLPVSCTPEFAPDGYIYSVYPTTPPVVVVLTEAREKLRKRARK
jgi:hypothetical protein